VQALGWPVEDASYAIRRLGAVSKKVRPREFPAQPLRTWPFLDFIAHLDLQAQLLNEPGAGFSTIWLSKRFGHVLVRDQPGAVCSGGENVARNVELSLAPHAQLEDAQLEQSRRGLAAGDFAA